MSVKQYEVGKEWEEELLGYYRNRGYFSYKFPTGFNGTICDIFVAKKGTCMFIEAKHITSDKLYYKGSGIYKKRDELDRFVHRSGNNIYIMIKSDELGVFWTTWLYSRETFENKGYLELEKDCFKAEIGDVD